MVVVASVLLAVLLCILLVNRAKSLLLMVELKVGYCPAEADCGSMLSVFMHA